jgi:hypothetical protein
MRLGMSGPILVLKYEGLGRPPSRPQIHATPQALAPSWAEPASRQAFSTGIATLLA